VVAGGIGAGRGGEAEPRPPMFITRETPTINSGLRASSVRCLLSITQCRGGLCKGVEMGNFYGARACEDV